MKKLSSKTLPKDLLAVVSLDERIDIIIKHRLATLARLNGVPHANSHIAILRRTLDLSSMEALKNSLIKLRNIVKCASDVIAQIPLLRTAKLTLDASTLVAYIKENSTVIGENLSDEDQITVAYLIVQSAMPKQSWTLKASEAGEGELPKLAALYSSISVKNYVGYEYAANCDAVSVISARKNQGAQKTLISAFNAIDGADAKGDKARKSANAYSQTSVKIADIILLDMVMELLMSTDLWLDFLPDRTADTPQENENRMKGLAALSALLHSTLIANYYVEYHLFLNTYITLETWLGDFPSVPEVVMKDLDRIVNNSDILQISSIIKTLFSTLRYEEPAHGASITMIPSEAVNLFGLNKMIDEAAVRVANMAGSTVPITQLEKLNSPALSSLIMSTSIGQANLRTSVIAAVYNVKLMELFASGYAASIAALIPKYITPIAQAKLAELSISLTEPFNPFIPVIPSIEQTTSLTIDSSVHQSVGRLPFTSSQEDMMRQEYFLKIVTSRGVYAKIKTSPLIDNVVAKSLADHGKFTFRSLIPSHMGMSANVVKVSDVANGSAHIIDDYLEFMSNQHVELLVRTFISPLEREKWATNLSSFALLFVSVADSDETATILPVREGKVVKNIKVRLIEGFGMPYGIKYATLATMNLLSPRVTTTKDVMGVKLFESKFSDFGEDNYYILPITRIPLPTHKLAMADFIYDYPYHYFQGDTKAIQDVDAYVWSEPLVNFALRPSFGIVTFPPVLFDRMHAYVNDILYLQDSMLMTIPAPAGDGGMAITTSEQEWKGQKYQPFVRYVTPGSFTSSRASTSMQPDELTNLIESIQDKVVDTIEKAPENQPPSDKLIPTIESDVTEKIVDTQDPSLSKKTRTKS